MGSSFSMGSKDSDDAFISALKSRAREIGDRIRFTGYIGHELVPDYLRLSDVAMIPSTWDDPFPTTVLEAMAAGLPIITTNRGGIPEMVSDQNAIVIPYPGDLTTNLAQAIRNLCHNEQQRKLMGMASKTQSSGYAKAAYAKNFFDEVLVEG
jgi:glycosyltransferase involved in cell wall biosynthesis